ncbi:RICIN domain-containing protein [Sphaerisporangium sp. B11E5]|uniref:RICIN domain-containing protein n=1 Tax=Sphaerisporangium sp. B11E5 TaxID=3153563 RepID=UPI00325E11CA
MRPIRRCQTAITGGRRLERETLTSRIRSAVRRPRRAAARAVMAAVMAAGALAGVATVSTPALAVAGGTSAAPPLVCTGDGTSGNRVQIVYAYEGADNLSLREPAIRQAIWEAQTNINDSARRDGGRRLLNVVHDGSCHALITTVQVPAGQTDAGNWILDEDLTAGDRIYLMIAEQTGECGAAWNDNVENDSTPGTGNLHNSRTGYVLVGLGCLNGHVVTHELAHALGGLLPGAPNSDGGGHCTDGHETLCQPATGAVCPDPISIRYLDCDGDDYFSLNPSGSYLPTHFNAALDSLYLTPGSPVTPLTVPFPLPPQYLRAVDIQGTSIAFSFRPPGDTAGVTAYEILRNGVLVATVPASERRTTARVDGLPAGTTAFYNVRSRVTVGGTSRYSIASQGLSATTVTGSTEAGDVAPGAVMVLTNENVQPDGEFQGAYQAMDSGNATDEDAGTLQHPRHEATNQQWKLTAATGGTYTVRSEYGGKCLAVLGGSTSAGAAIVQSTCTGAANQRWAFVPVIGLTYQLRNAGSNLCAQTENLSTAMLAPLVQGTCSSSEPSQRWSVHRMG